MNASAPPRDHDRFEELAAAWAIDALEPADQVVFEEHRDGCVLCERTVLASLEVAAELAYGVPDVDPPAQLRRRVLAAATPRPPVQGTAPEVAPGRREYDPDDDLGGPAGFAALDLSGDRDRTHGAHPTEGLGDRDRTSGVHPSEGLGDRDRTSGAHPSEGLGDRDRTHGAHPTEDPGDRDRTSDDAPADGERPRARGRDDADDGPGDRPAGTVGGHRDRGGDRAGSGLPERTGSAGSRSPGHRRPRSARPGPVRTGSRRRRIVSVLAAAALVGISAVTTWEVTRPAAVTAPVAAPDRTATLSPPAGQGTVATVVVRAGSADVVTDALAPNPEGRQFYVWGVPAGGAGTPQVVGTFTVTTSGLHSYPVQLTRSLQDYPVLAISEEAAGSTPATPSPILARGALSR